MTAAGVHKNGHKLSDTGDRLVGDLRAIGWTVNQAARRSGLTRRRIRRCLDDGWGELPFREWVGALAALHRRYANPLSPGVVPDDRPTLTAAGIGMALLTIGWSERICVQRAGEHRTAFRRALAGEGRLSASLSRWLELLSEGHVSLPRPIMPRETSVG